METLMCVVRHGETEWNRLSVLQGSLDIPLNDTGREQAKTLAQTLRHCRFDRVYASPLVRAFETADILATSLGLATPLARNDLRERHFGKVQGLPKSRLAELDPVLCEQIHLRNPAIELEDGEALNDFADRVLACLTDIASEHRGQRCLVVTHGWVMDVITREARNVPRDRALPLKRKNGEAVWLRVDAQGMTEVNSPEDQLVA